MTLGDISGNGTSNDDYHFVGGQTSATTPVIDNVALTHNDLQCTMEPSNVDSHDKVDRRLVLYVENISNLQEGVRFGCLSLEQVEGQMVETCGVRSGSLVDGGDRRKEGGCEDEQSNWRGDGGDQPKHLLPTLNSHRKVGQAHAEFLTNNATHGQIQMVVLSPEMGNLPTCAAEAMEARLRGEPPTNWYNNPTVRVNKQSVEACIWSGRNSDQGNATLQRNVLWSVSEKDVSIVNAIEGNGILENGFQRVIGSDRNEVNSNIMISNEKVSAIQFLWAIGRSMRASNVVP
ncbi:hypothetical protein VNO78_08559 [Psophocarpus tetragonolobus]|uniref:Uncharacterized protein n=1 Tax=Psophocarpus tetragonolobus TaxID=3891 RepID=A0AAN9T5F8_PSOTE